MKNLLTPTLLLLVGCQPVLDSGLYRPELPISQQCEAPVIEVFPYGDHAIGVSREHCIDKMGPDQDGYYEFYYDYELFEFSLGTTILHGRSYLDDPEEAHLTGVEVAGETKFLAVTDLQGILPRAAIHYFHTCGKTQLNWLDPSNELNGYSAIP
jgi:hypothetical protein